MQTLAVARNILSYWTNVFQIAKYIIILKKKAMCDRANQNNAYEKWGRNILLAISKGDLLVSS